MASLNNNASHVAKVDFGTPPNNFPEWETAEVRFHAFRELDSTRGVAVGSPAFTCLGHRWSLRLFPGGCHNSAQGNTGIHLRHLSEQKIRIKFGFCMKDSHGRDEQETGCDSKLRDNAFLSISASETEWNSRGVRNFAEYSSITTITNGLVEGALVIEVRMKIIGSASESPPLPFIPENPLGQNILKKFMDETTADVVFEVDCESKEVTGSNKKAKISPTTFHAHRLILIDSAPTFAELCKVGGDMTPVKITDVEPEIFRHMLYYVYGGRIPNEDLKSHAKGIIDAADKYGAVNLKLEAEACYVQSTAITMDNVIDNLLYADTKNCALLKEAVMDFLVENGGEAVEKLSFQHVPGYLMKDLLSAVHIGKKQDKKDASDYSTMMVSTLRKMLHEKGLDVDGSREAMIALLKENS
mmetsp:Transcript_33110/g.69684  ORF Transcript_33110/g.69684 Transcript_33110/m.69684 type:complete len:413 (-) Transcript_33110:557-1795(-)|eukprot:CAMPEP_0172306930 /NCGR_PEP_ID=MMETSP1058-20130122/7890_1 /TAXON_ID=83371 /ORGANISM="Detonula confervacea, Strain CCMP 353" /LENGTH=412 /DNA_ID=CAMNT_0013018971 /DNA_START=37 /DNA_END=1275 /DNA_ORIENTATION=-